MGSELISAFFALPVIAAAVHIPLCSPVLHTPIPTGLFTDSGFIHQDCFALLHGLGKMSIKFRIGLRYRGNGVVGFGVEGLQKVLLTIGITDLESPSKFLPLVSGDTSDVEKVAAVVRHDSQTDSGYPTTKRWVDAQYVLPKQRGLSRLQKESCRTLTECSKSDKAADRV